jgi:tagatose 1,6-diphosphate aldolase
MKFLEPGELRDGELELVLVDRRPPNPARGIVPAYLFQLRVGGNHAGHVDFRAGSTRDLERYGGHIGYAVDPLHRGHHYAERAVRLILPFVRRHGFTSLWITCNPDNTASRRTCERLGATLVDVVPLPPDNDQYARGDREKCRYRLELAQMI